jgi:hypothetical protein
MTSQPTEKAKDLARKVRERALSKAYPYTVRGRLHALEQEVQENRQLNRRIAELTDVVAELLVPLQDRDEAKVNEVLEKYRRGI